MDRVYAFGPFRLDISAEILFRGADPLTAGRRAVGVLRALLEHPGVPVSKDALMQAAWPGLAVEDNNLTVQIATLRRVLGEEPGGDKWIETLPRRGYRFVGPAVTKGNPDGAGAVAMRADPLPWESSFPPVPDRPSIAVLSFENLSGDTEQDYFADGMVEEIITSLSRIRWLFVIARNSSFTYKGRNVDARQIGRELGVGYVLEGSIRKAADRVRITGQLIDASSGTHIWADRFDGALGDIFELQDQVTASVVGAIAPKLEQAEIERAKHKPTESLSAYDYYLRGRANLRSGTKLANDEALRLFYTAIQLDVDFASLMECAPIVMFGGRQTGGWKIRRARLQRFGA